MQEQSRVILEPDEPGEYAVTVRMLPGCISEGDTKEAALGSTNETTEFCLASLHTDSEPRPAAKRAGIAIEGLVALV